MSDRQLGDDWWLASDGKWYPPQSRPAAPAPPPQGSGAAPAYAPYEQAPGRPHARTHLSFGLTGTLVGFIIATSIMSAIASFLYFAAWGISADNGSTFGEVIRAWDAAASAGGFYLLLFIVTFILLLIWLNLAYKSGQSRGAIDRKWGSGWTVGAWFIPFANLVIPKLVVNEVDRMSRTELSEPIGAAWKGMPRLVTSDLWWALYLAGILATTIADSGVDSSPDFFALYAVGQLTIAVSGGFLAHAILTIGKRLRAEPPSAFGSPTS
jgi:hypothetical protein